ncbi:hypothetical protein D3C76_1136820 [compost metagenome]
MTVILRILLLQQSCRTQGNLKRLFNQCIRKSIIVHTLMIFIRTCNIQNLKPLFNRIIVSVRVEKASAFPDHLCSSTSKQTFIPCELNIFPDPMHNVTTDMNLLIAEIGAHRPACKYIIHIKQSTGIVSRILTFPSIKCAQKSIFRCLTASTIQCMNPVHHQVPRYLRITVQEKRQHKHFRIPEYSSLIYLTR